MAHIRCRDIAIWIQRSILSNEQVPATAPLVSHVATCSICQGALTLLALQALQLPDIPPSLPCDRCQNDLAAFIDLEQSKGSATAARRLPSFWWHLWTCQECAEDYDLGRQVIAAIGRDAPWKAEPIAPRIPSHGPRHTPRKPLVYLNRQYLSKALTTGTLRGYGDDIVVAKGNVSDLQYILSVRSLANAMWQITVTTKPPIQGQILFTLGEQHFRAHFNAQGTAYVSDVPDLILRSDNGPDLEVSIDQEED